MKFVTNSVELGEKEYMSRNLHLADVLSLELCKIKCAHLVDPTNPEEKSSDDQITCSERAERVQIMSVG